jgi:uncharacterized damage-inducible protein DinB
MPISKALIAELHHESGVTRKVLQRIPSDKLDWAPHPKSMTLSRLATHIADLHQWPVFIVTGDDLDMATTNLRPRTVDTMEIVLQDFEQKLSSAIQVLENVTDEELEKPWSLRRGDHIIFTLPRKVTLRSMVMNHIVHHRGQLSVYLRLLDIPVPSIYGPSADEQVF